MRNKKKNSSLNNVNVERQKLLNTFYFIAPDSPGQRSAMKEKIRSFWPGHVNENFLLGGGGVRLPSEHWQCVVSAVANFVRDTKRFI